MKNRLLLSVFAILTCMTNGIGLEVPTESDQPNKDGFRITVRNLSGEVMSEWNIVCDDDWRVTPFGITALLASVQAGQDNICHFVFGLDKFDLVGKLPSSLLRAFSAYEKIIEITCIKLPEIYHQPLLDNTLMLMRVMEILNTSITFPDMLPHQHNKLRDFVQTTLDSINSSKQIAEIQEEMDALIRDSAPIFQPIIPEGAQYQLEPVPVLQLDLPASKPLLPELEPQHNVDNLLVPKTGSSSSSDNGNPVSDSSNPSEINTTES